MNPDFPFLASKTIKSLNDATIVARLAHWNVRGVDFFSYHLLYERVYKELADLMDSLVESLRVFGYSPNFELFSGPAMSLLSFDTHLLTELTLDHLWSLSSVLAVFLDSCESCEDPRIVGLSNNLQGMADKILGLQYLLQATCGK